MLKENTDIDHYTNKPRSNHSESINFHDNTLRLQSLFSVSPFTIEKVTIWNLNHLDIQFGFL